MGLPNIGPLELIIILAIALLIVGPGRLPEMGNAIGRTIREFRNASTDITDAAKVDTDTPATAATPAATTTAATAAPAAAPASAAPETAAPAAAEPEVTQPEANTPSTATEPSTTSAEAEPTAASEPKTDGNDDA